MKNERALPIALACLSVLAWPRAPIAAADPQPPAAASPLESAVSAEDRRRIEAALPEKPVAPPAKPRRLLIFDLNVGYPGHGSIHHANLAFTRMGQRTGAFEATVSRDPEVFRAESLRRFDAVFLNNTVGNLFRDPDLRKSLAEFVWAGGGLMGVHGTTVAFTVWPGAVEDWPEFGRMLGGRGARHRESDERVVVRLDDPGHPLLGTFGGEGFEYRDEFFRVGDPYSRDRVRVLLSIDTERTDVGARESWVPERADGDYALAWVRSHGRGRVFYSTIAHGPRVFQDPRMLRFYLAASQFVLGDLPAPTLPSSRLTPEVRAQEKLGWRLGVEAYTFHKVTFFETIDRTAKLGLSFIGGLSFQKVSPEIPRNFDETLGDDDLARIREKLDAAGLRILTFYIQKIPGDEAGCRKVFELGRKMGIETFLSEPDPADLDAIERMADEYGIDVALHNHGKDASPSTWHPDEVLKLCRGRGKRIGACADVGYWMRAGIDPIEGIRALGDRLITVQMHDLHDLGPDGHDVPWGTGKGRTAEILREFHRLGIRPTMFGLEYSYDFDDNVEEAAACARFFETQAASLASGSGG